MRRRAAVVVLLILLAALHVAVLAAGFIAPYEAATQNRDLAYAPPTRVHLRDASGWHAPFVYRWIADAYGYREDPSTRYPIRFFAQGKPHSVLWIFRSKQRLFGVDEPARILLLGADSFGRDEFSRLLYGGQISLAVGLLATFITLASAIVVGTVAGYFGKWVDESLMAAGELFLCLPWFYLLVGARAFLPLNVSAAGTFLLLIIVIGIIGWARPARLIRGMVLSARHRNYVLAARGFGASNFYLLRRHILPETFAILLTQAALLIPQYIAAEATLSFFGLGVSEPVPSWGNMLNALQQYNVLVSYSWLLAPAGALVITSVMYWLLADVLHHWIQSHSIN